MLTTAGARPLILRVGPGVPCATGIHHLAVTGEAWTQSGLPGWLRRNRTCEILAAGPPRQIAWRTIATPLFADGTHWRITLKSAGTGTPIVPTFQITKRPRCRAHRRPAPDRALAAGARATKPAGHPDHRRDDGAAAGTIDQRGRLR